MNVFAKWRIFPKVATATLVVFLGLMVFVTIVAHTRPSGSTRQDMAKTQIQRREAVFGPTALVSPPAVQFDEAQLTR